MGLALIVMGGAACLDAPPSAVGSDDARAVPSDGGGPAGDCLVEPTSAAFDDFLVADGLTGWDVISDDDRCILDNHTDDVFVENTAPDGHCYLRSLVGRPLDRVWLMIDNDHIGTGDPEAEFRIWLSASRRLAIQELSGAFYLLDCEADDCVAVGGSVPAGVQQFWRFQYIPTSETVTADISTDQTDWIAFAPVSGIREQDVACVFVEAGSYGDPEGDNDELTFEGINVDQ